MAIDINQGIILATQAELDGRWMEALEIFKEVDLHLLRRMDQYSLTEGLPFRVVHKIVMFRMERILTAKMN